MFTQPFAFSHPLALIHFAIHCISGESSLSIANAEENTAKNANAKIDLRNTGVSLLIKKKKLNFNNYF